MAVNTIKIYFSRKRPEKAREEQEQEAAAIQSMTAYMKYPHP